jgi:hypothetical protein
MNHSRSSTASPTFDAHFLRRLVLMARAKKVKDTRRLEEAEVRKFNRLLRLAALAGLHAERLDRAQRLELQQAFITGELPSAALQRLAPSLEPLLSGREAAEAIVEVVLSEPVRNANPVTAWLWPLSSRILRMLARFRIRRSVRKV